MIRKQGYVALLDILGFSERVALDAELGGLDAYISTVIEGTQPYPELRVILFSDTVLIYTIDDAPAALQQIVEATSGVEHALLAKEVPLRGAIAHGVFSRSDNEQSGTVVAGRPIIEAHHYEAQLQWVGVMLAPSFLRQVPELSSRGIVHGPRDGEDSEDYFARISRDARIQPCEQIPVEPTPHSQTAHLVGFAVVPFEGGSHSPDALKRFMSSNLAKLRRMKELAPDPRSQAKYQNTIDWLESLYHAWITRLR